MKFNLKNYYSSSRIKSFLISMLLFGIVIGLYNGAFNNYLYEVLSLTKAERGWLELPRELPGLFLVAVLAVLYRFSEIKLIRAAFFLTGAALLILFLFGNNRIVAVILMMVYSTGEHIMMPVRQSVGLHFAREGKDGVAMGILRGFGNAGQAVGYYLGPLIMLAVVFFTKSDDPFTKYRTVFLVAFLILAVGLVLSFRLKKSESKVNRKKIYIRKKYTKYYLLEVFFGARKQVFLTFAPYVLITVYGAGAELISVLYGLWSIINIFIGPVIGRLIDRVGYKKVLIADSIVLIFVCLIYGFAHRLLPFNTAYVVICIVFVLDAVMFAFGMARDMYARSLSETKDEVTSTLATGLSVNHLIGIFIAIGGGILWESLGIEFLFSLAALLGLFSLLFSALLEKPEKMMNRLV